QWVQTCPGASTRHARDTHNSASARRSGQIKRVPLLNSPYRDRTRHNLQCDPPGLLISALSWRRCILLPHRSENIEIEDGLVADHLTPMHHVRRDLQQAARPEQNALVANVETDVPGQDVNELLVSVFMR